MQPRPWRGWEDLPAMQRIASSGLARAPGRGYVHPGDVAWMLGWRPSSRSALSEEALIVEDDDRVIGWALLDDDDVAEYVEPEILDAAGTDRFFTIVDGWLRGRAGVLRFAADGDVAADERLRRASWEPIQDGLRLFTRSLEHVPPATAVAVSAVDPDADPTGRCSITYAAFGSEQPFDAYVEAYRTFMRSPAYPAGSELVASSPDGAAAACCIAWTDPATAIGNFEPVATHPSFARKGFGRAVMEEGLRRFAAAGMRRAIVRTASDNAPAAALYRSLGFEDDGFLRAYALAG